jgi:hypothetical protein
MINTNSLQCDGIRPRCDQCTTREVVCEYIETAAKEMRRTYQRLRDQRNAHEELLDLLKLCRKQMRWLFSDASKLVVTFKTY